MRLRFGLQAKVVAGLLALSAAPIVASAVFIGQLAEVAQSVADGEAERLQAPLERAAEAYREAVAARKEAFRRAAAAVAADPGLRDACRGRADRARLTALLAGQLEADPSLARAWLRGAAPGWEVEAEASRPPPAEDIRDLTLDKELVEAPECRLALTYVTPARLLEDHRRLGKVLAERRARGQIRRALPGLYSAAFVALVAIVMAVTATFGLLAARATIRRIDRLVAATRRVGEGDLDARVALGGSDELADLAAAFDEMVADLKRSRAEIEYLHKIGAWQEVARRLAHEIKNPLTPIQLAVQQLHGKYAGDDPRFRKLLDDAHEVVTEEIAGLRRLVDAFRGFATLPRVDPRPLDLAVVVEDVSREADMETEPPAAPLTVAGDRLLLRRALVNLVENARQAGARRVRVAWRRVGADARLTVDDDGPGVPPEVRERVFDPYVTTKEHGTGLGLAIVKKTVLEHHGDVTLSSEPSPLGGARFEIRLPAARDGSGPGASRGPASGTARRSGPSSPA